MTKESSFHCDSAMKKEALKHEAEAEAKQQAIAAALEAENRH